MRVDKYLKNSRLIKRRTLAKEACDQGRVMVNDKVVKSGHELKIGDKLSLRLGENEIKVEVISLNEIVRKDEACDLYRKL